MERYVPLLCSDIWCYNGRFMACLRSLATALPPNLLTQAQARATCEKAYAGHPGLLRLLGVFDRSGVATRHLAFPPDYYLSRKTFEERNADYIEVGLGLGEKAARLCLDRARVEGAQIDHFFFVTTTGLATPSLDALLAPRLGLRSGARRWPLFGLGCAGGAGALIRAGEALAPGERALVLSVELCGQAFSMGATKPVDLIGAALFGDGAAAVLVEAGESGPGPRILARGTELFPDSEHLMGWRFTQDGMRLVLSREVTDLVGRRLRPVVDGFLQAAGLRAADVAHWILHPGGRRILEAYRTGFGLGDQELEWTRKSLERVGNLSSASILFTLADLWESGQARPGERALLAALGPGFAAEMLVLGW